MTTLLTPVREDLEKLPRPELVGMVEQLRGIIRAKNKSLELLQAAFDQAIEQRDAALLLNELCHY